MIFFLYQFKAAMRISSGQKFYVLNGARAKLFEAQFFFRYHDQKIQFQNAKEETNGADGSR
jgi:hypothetical protein